MNTSTAIDDPDVLQRETFGYFLHEANPLNGLIVDKTETNWPASIAATGLALACYPVGVERGFMTRSAAVERTLATLRFFWNSPQGPEPEATGYRGFYYHFLDMQTGRRAWRCELSTIDTTFLLAGALAAAEFFNAKAATFRWENCYGYEYLYAGPLFIHQLSHVWIDFRGIQDAFMRSAGLEPTSHRFQHSRTRPLSSSL